MFLRTLSFLVTAGVVGVAAFYLFEIIETAIIVPRVCMATMMDVQEFLMRNGRGFYEKPVVEALDNECANRTMHFVGINVVIFTAIALLFPSELTFWIILPWSIKTGLLGASLVNTICDLIMSRRTKGHVGRFSHIDNHGNAHFEGFRAENFMIAERFCCWKTGNPPPVGKPYYVMEYFGFICSASLVPVASSD